MDVLLHAGHGHPALLWIGVAVALSLAAGVVVGRHWIGTDGSTEVAVGEEA